MVQEEFNEMPSRSSSPNMLLISNTGLLVEKNGKYLFKKLYSSLKRGVYRPDSTYKTAKMIYQEYSH